MPPLIKFKLRIHATLITLPYFFLILTPNSTFVVLLTLIILQKINILDSDPTIQIQGKKNSRRACLI